MKLPISENNVNQLRYGHMFTDVQAFTFPNFQYNFLHSNALPFEFLGNSRTQTKQTKQKFIRLYCLDSWIKIIQSDEENKSSTNVLKSK